MSSKSKSKLIQTRPEPPGLEDVRTDLERAANNDVAFTFFSTFDTSMSNVKPLSNDPGPGASELEISGMSWKTSGSSHSSKKESQSDVDACYSKVINFLEMNEALKHSQSSLADQCSELQELGGNVKEQVDRLRTQMK